VGEPALLEPEVNILVGTRILRSTAAPATEAAQM
jgi:hypothetical protein